jgi:hypothetical protein
VATTGVRDEDRLIELFLSMNENKSWAAGLSTRESPERGMDGGVELIATPRARHGERVMGNIRLRPLLSSDLTNGFTNGRRQVLRFRTDSL